MARKSKTVEVEVPEVDQLPVEPDLRARLDTICRAERAVAEQIGQLQKTKDALRDEREPIVERIAGLGVERVLGHGWDLRKATRKSLRLNEDRLKMRLLQIGWDMAAVLALVEECTDTTESTSWSVYGRD